MRTAFLLPLLLTAAASAQTLVGTAFTYQGKISTSGAPASGPHDLQFRLFDAPVGGTQLGAAVCLDNITPAADGTFTASLDFGDFMTGAARYLQISVRADTTAGNCSSGAYTTLTPRQALSPTPYALALALPTDQSVTIDTLGASALSITNRSTMTGTYAIAGRTYSTGADSAGLIGYALGATGATAGVRGVNLGQNGYGIAGFAANSASDANGVGVFGYSNAPAGIGLFANAVTTTGPSKSILAWNASTRGVGADILASAATGSTIGVSAVVNSPDGVALRGVHSAPSGITPAIYGESRSTSFDARAIHGVMTPPSPGFFSSAVRGENLSTSDAGIGVYGSHLGSGYGVYGTTPSGYGVVGEASGVSGVNYGVFGSTASPDGYAGYFANRIFVAGDVLHKFTPAAEPQRMTPIAYGYVRADGTTVNATANVSVVVSGITYTITIAGENYFYTDYTTVVTPATSLEPIVPGANSGGGKLIVRLYNLSGASINRDFYFVVFKR